MKTTLVKGLDCKEGNNLNLSEKEKEKFNAAVTKMRENQEFYSIYHWMKYVKKEGGIYIFYDRFDEKRIMYIGKSQNVYFRFLEYTNIENEKNHLKEIFHNIGSFQVIYVDEEKIRQEAEKHLIQKLNPPFNKEFTDRTIVDIDYYTLRQIKENWESEMIWRERIDKAQYDFYL